MLKEEVIWFKRELKKIPASKLSVTLNLGSGNKFLRSTKQPWIQKYLFTPLEQRKVKVVHLDVCSDDVVDIVLDIEKERIAKISGLKSVFANNILEHVVSPKKVAKKIEDIVPTGGYIFVSVPYKYPYHPSPIDNMFRPDPSELASLFPGFKIVAQNIVYGGTLTDALSKEKTFKIPSIKYWRSILSHLAFLNCNFAVSCLVLWKVDQSAPPV